MLEYINYKNGDFADVKDLDKFAKNVDLSNSEIEYSGVPVFGVKDKIKVLDHDVHSVCFGTTGAMKTTRYLLPTAISIVKRGESMIVNDPKGEIFSKLHKMLKEKEYNIIILNFRDPFVGNKWNPLKLAGDLFKNNEKDQSDIYLRDIGSILYHDITKYSQDIFWGQCSTDLFVGLCQIIRDESDGELLTIENVRLTNALGFERTYDGTYLKQYYSLSNKMDEKCLNIESTILSPSQTLSSVRSVFSQSLNVYGHSGLRDMMATSDFDIKAIGTQKTALFMITPAERTIFNPIISAFIKQSYSALIDLVVSRNPNRALPVRLNYLLDEFSNLVKIPDFSQMITMARSANIRFNLVVQSVSQLYSVYSKAEAENIMNNCEAWFVFRSKDLVLHDMITHMCGSRIYDHTREERPLITSTDIQKLSKNDGEVLLLLSGMDPIVTYLPSIYDFSFTLDNYDISNMPAREIVPRVEFRIDKVVKALIVSDIKSDLDIFSLNIPSNLDIDKLIARLDEEILDYDAGLVEANIDEDENDKDKDS